jgi:hypothetical protein
MPLVGFKPTKARLVIEQNKESVLVMKVVVASGETVELTSGGTLESLAGILRIREHSNPQARRQGKVSGSLVFVDGDSRGAERIAPRFQINLAMNSRKFGAVLDLAKSGRLPTKFFIEAGERVGAFQSRGLTYDVTRKGRVKVWNTRSHRLLPVSNFSMILPIVVTEPAAGPNEQVVSLNQSAIEIALSDQVAELADDMLAFQSETKYTLTALIAIIGVIVVLLLVFNIVLVFK